MLRSTRLFVFLLACSFGGAAMANDIDTANRLLSEKQYPQALELFGKLAGAGNPEAQLRLGEMYWYGEGVGVDRAKADALFARAAAAGNQAAVAAAKLSSRRAASADAIAWWTRGYKGADLAAAQAACAVPVIPAVSKINDEINVVNAKLKSWSSCHNSFVGQLAKTPPLKAIPDDVLELMNEKEIAEAKAHLDKVALDVLAKAKTHADAVLAQSEKWKLATADEMAAQTKSRLVQFEISQRSSTNTMLGSTGPRATGK
jgi:uncharacterized protein